MRGRRPVRAYRSASGGWIVVLWERHWFWISREGVRRI